MQEDDEMSKKFDNMSALKQSSVENGEMTFTLDSSLSEKVAAAAAKSDVTAPRFVVDAIFAAGNHARSNVDDAA